MHTMIVSLPEAMKAFVDEQIAARGYGTSSEYVRDLICRDKQGLELRSLLLQGGLSAPTAEVDQTYFGGLRERVRVAVHGRRGPVP
jgi:antitoxin ParD1/3/4